MVEVNNEDCLVSMDEIADWNVEAIICALA